MVSNDVYAATGSCSPVRGRPPLGRPIKTSPLAEIPPSLYVVSFKVHAKKFPCCMDFIVMLFDWK